MGLFDKPCPMPEKETVSEGKIKIVEDSENKYARKISLASDFGVGISSSAA